MNKEDLPGKKASSVPIKDKDQEEKQEEFPAKIEIQHIGSGGAFTASEGEIEEHVQKPDSEAETPY
ncbi:MAG: hypothetical protein H7Y03_01715 [Chitinophagaceae bacterium]|nr:hypothetical protein [Chitinophagaceae bacterium]